MTGHGLRQVMYPVSDFAESVSFYRDTVGLRLIAEFDPSGNTIGLSERRP